MFCITLHTALRWALLSTVLTMKSSKQFITGKKSALRTLTLGSNATMTFSGVISNTSGGLTLSANANGTAANSIFAITNTANTFSGTLTLSNGVEGRFTDAGSYGNASSTILNDGSILSTPSGAIYTIASTHSIQVGAGATTINVLGAAGVVTYNGAIVNKAATTGTLKVNAAGTLVLGGACTYTGLTKVNAGTLQLNASGGGTLLATNDITVNGATAILKISTDQTLNNLILTSGTVVIDPGVTLTINGTFTHTAGTITDNGALVIAASGAMICNANQITGTGTVTVNGSLSTTNANGLSGTTLTTVSSTITSLTLGSASTIDYLSATTQIITAANYANLISNNGNGIRTFSSTGIIGIATSFSPGTGLYTIGTSTVDYNGTTNISPLPVPPVSSGGNYYKLTVTGSGTYTMTSNVTVANDFTVNGTGASFRVSNGGSKTLTVNGNASVQLGTLQGNGTGGTGASVMNVAGSFTQSGGTVNLNNATAGNAGTFTLAITGALSVSGGTFNVLANSGGTTSITAATFSQTGGTVTLNAGGTATATVTIAGTTTINTTGTSGIVMQTGAGGLSIFQTQDLTIPTTATSTRLIDWGTNATLSANEFRITGNFSKAASVGIFYTSSSSAATGFVFNGAGTLASPQTLSYAGTNSDYTSYTVNTGTAVKLLTNLNIGPLNSTIPPSSFTANGIMDCSTFKITGGGANCTFALNSGATLVSASANGIVTGALGAAGVITSTFDPLANYIFNGSVAQNTNFKSASQPMNNLTIDNSGGGTGVTLNNTATVNGTLTLTNGAFTLSSALTMGFGSTIIRDKQATTGGSISVAPTFGSSVNVTYTGTTAVTSGPEIPSLATVLAKLTINNSGNVTLGSNAQVNGTVAGSSLLFTAGKLITGANTVTMSSTAADITGASTTSYVKGTLVWNLPAGASTKKFEIGNGVYAPATLSTTGAASAVISGKATNASAPNEASGCVGGNCSGINQAAKCDHYWTMTKVSGSFTNYTATYDLTNTTNSGTVGGAITTYKIRKYDPTVWVDASTAPAGQTITTTTLTSMSDFEVGSPNSAPTVTCNGNLSINTSGFCNATITNGQLLGQVTTGGSPTPTVTFSPAAGTFSVGTTSVTATVTNIDGTNNCSFNVIVVDNEAPVIGGCPANITQCDNNVATWTDPTATDNCSAIVACSPVSGSTFATGATTVTCTATDPANLTSSCSFTVTINITPVISGCPASFTVCDNFHPTWTTPTATGTPAPSVACVPASGSLFALGTTPVTCTATNSCGSDACSFNVTVNASPVISGCPADFTVCDNLHPTWTAPTATGTPAPSVACVPASGSLFALGTTPVTCTATNSCGSDGCSFNVTVNASPVISGCPADFTVCDNLNPTWTTPTATGTPAPSVACVPASGSLFALGTTPVTCTATNSCGSDGCSFNVTVNASPVISGCPSNITQCDNHVATWTDPTATGTPTPVVACVPASGSTFATGATTVNCTATNSCGSDACSFTVTISTSPTANAGPDQSICYTGTAQLAGSIGGGASSSTWTRSGDGTFDDASLLNAVYTPGPSDIISGTVTLTLTTDDPAGPCSAVADQMILTVLNSPPSKPAFPTGPTVACVGNIFNYTIPAVPTAASYTWTSLLPGSASIAGGGTAVSINFFGALPGGTSYYPFSVYATNACGNSLTRSFSIQNKISVPSFTGGLPVVVCQNTNGVTYSIVPLGAGITYTWTITGSGATINGSNTGSSISVDFATFTSVTISVTATNACMTTAARSMTVTSSPVIPGAITGPTYVCPGGTYAYSVPAVPGASTYLWTAPAGSSIAGNSNSVTITFGGTIPGGATVGVSATGTCANSSAARTKGVGNGKPNTPGNISGLAAGQCGQTGVSYSIAPVLTPVAASSYTWTVNNGASISGPNNLSGVTIDFPANFVSVTLSVIANNACGSSSARTLVVTGVSNTPTSISSSTNNFTPCNTDVVTYCAVGSTNATSYVWTVPAGATILGSATGSCIIVQWGATGGTLTCKALNGCGQSGTKTQAVTVSCREAQVSRSVNEFNAQVYPNPAADKATVKFNAVSADKYSISLVDMMGKEAMIKKGAATEGANMIELDLSSYAKGVYMIRLQSGEQSEMIRLIIN